jgi:hypothetical protein
MIHINRIVKGYLACAEWADKPEGSNARFTKSSIEEARADCLEFTNQCGLLFYQAINCDDYSAEQFGSDFWLTRCGHGAGFWDREQLQEKAIQNWFALDRDGKQYLINGRGDSLGDYLSAIAYGDSSHISKFAYAELQAYRGWLYFF